jgi:hypothetical protein
VKAGWHLIKKVGGIRMDFIEQIFGVSPDGGSGILELLLFLIPVAGMCIIAADKLMRRNSAETACCEPAEPSPSSETPPTAQAA